MALLLNRISHELQIFQNLGTGVILKKIGWRSTNKHYPASTTTFVSPTEDYPTLGA